MKKFDIKDMDETNIELFKESFELSTDFLNKLSDLLIEKKADISLGSAIFSASIERTIHYLLISILTKKDINDFEKMKSIKKILTNSVKSAINYSKETIKNKPN